MEESVERLKEEIVKVGKYLLDKDLTIGSSGNISVRVREKELVLITPSGVPFDIMKPNDIVVVDMNGEVVEGERNPSTEMPTHLRIYKERKDVNAIIHAHAIYTGALAATHTSIPAVLDEMILYLGGEVEVAEYAPPGTEELAENAVKALGRKKAVILANHGVLVCGKDLKDTLEILLRVERVARIYILSKIIGEPRKLPKEAIEHELEIYELLLEE
ncbi:MAG: class II aldolase/adducin family protein [Candidatus Njordarchaeales archaeon]